MSIEILEFSLKELLEHGEEYLFPGTDIPDLIPRRMWNPVKIDEEPELWNIGLMESDGAFSEAPAAHSSTR